VVLENVTKRFGDVTIIDNLSIRINNKEFMVFVGPSGSGKTTLLRMLAGFESVSEGVIRFGEREVNDLPSKDRNIAMVFETDALYPHLTVDENLAFGLALRKTPVETRMSRIQEAIFSLGLPGLRSRKPKELSSGERQQVAIGRAMVHEPELFLMDEPLANLDPKRRISMRAEIRKLHQRLKTTFIYVTHDQVEAMTLGERIAVLDEGVLQQVGAPLELYNRPANVFVAGFIGSPSMNFLNANLAEEEGRIWIDAGAFRVPIPADKRLKSQEAYIGREVIFGFRPEQVYGPGFAPADIIAEPFKARVDMAELLGAKYQLHLKIGGQDLIAKVDAGIEPVIGQDIELYLDMSIIHLFDPGTELAIR
jgi:multiple sugar transport system ATP-binding protein